MKFIESSDWHFDGGLTRFFPSNALEKQLREVKKPFAYAVESGVRHIMVPGDISDKARLSEDTLISAIGLVMAYSKYVNVHYTLGNHDFAHVGKTAVDVLKLFSETGAVRNLRIYDKPTIKEIEGVDCCFMPYPHVVVPKHYRPKLIFAHIEEQGATGDNGLPLKKVGLKLERPEEDFVFSGHLHTYQYLKNRRIVFGGSLYQKNFGESLPKGWIDGEAKYSSSGALKVRHEFVNGNPSFVLQNVTIENDKDWDSLEAGDHVFYKVQLGEGIVAPKNITRDFPNIVYLNGQTFKGRSKIELGDGQVKTDADLPKITPLTGLVKMLETFELDHKEVKRCVHMVKYAIKELNIQIEV